MLVGWYSTVYTYVDRLDDRLDEHELETSSPKYGGILWARSNRHARKIAELRGLNEWVGIHSKPRKERGWSLPSTLILSNPQEAAHGVTFLSFIAAAAKVVDPIRDLLSDTGIVHEAVHIAAGTYDGSAFELAKTRLAIMELELKVPGFLSWQERQAHINYLKRRDELLDHCLHRRLV